MGILKTHVWILEHTKGLPFPYIDGLHRAIEHWPLSGAMPEQWKPTGEKLPTGEVSKESMRVDPAVAAEREAAFATKRAQVRERDSGSSSRTIAGSRRRAGLLCAPSCCPRLTARRCVC